MKNKKIIAIITARGGSKGLPGKNIKVMAGKPLIAWTIAQSLESKYIDKTIVSTDDEKIAEISRQYGAEVPFMRPKELAGDNSSSIDVIMHAISWLEKQGEHFDIIVLLEPTSPLREVKDIDKSIEILLDNPKAQAIVGIAKLESSHPEFNVVLNRKGFIRKWQKGNADFKVLPRQKLSDVYFFEGSLYVSYVEVLNKKRTFYHERTLGYIVPKYKSLEIDDIYDFVMIEAILKNQLKKT